MHDMQCQSQRSRWLDLDMIYQSYMMTGSMNFLVILGHNSFVWFEISMPIGVENDNPIQST